MKPGTLRGEAFHGNLPLLSPLLAGKKYFGEHIKTGTNICQTFVGKWNLLPYPQTGEILVF